MTVHHISATAQCSKSSPTCPPRPRPSSPSGWRVHDRHFGTTLSNLEAPKVLSSSRVSAQRPPSPAPRNRHVIAHDTFKAADHETAGDPVRGLKWTRRTTAKVAAELCKLGTDICARTVARLLKKMGFSLRVNHKKRAGASHPNRDEQFQHIAELREPCAADNVPVISVDTKKKELVGAFRNPGAKWDHSPELVNDHDCPSAAEGRAIPYGIYDPRANAGTVFVGQTADTPAFAVDCIEQWWRTEGHKHYPEAEALQILADGGGSNSCTARAWKFNLQHRLCNRHRLRVTVAHYPPATSKWNPIEHRLFCEVTKNWAGRPLDSYETILKYLRTTRTATGLRVRAHLVRKTYKTGVKVTEAQMRELRITPNSLLPKWNYTIEPM